METSIFEDPEFMKSPFRATSLQPRTEPFERLEFLGDRVLNLVTAHMLYKAPYFRDRDVGDLATSHALLVSKYLLVDMYKDLHIDPSKLSSPFYYAPESGCIAEKTASDIVEALMGALYMERGFEKVQEPLEQFIEKYWSLKDEKPIKRIQKTPLSTISLIRMWSPSFKNFTPLEEALDYHFKNVNLLQDAFHHPSTGGEVYKKLGFLGVRVLGLVIADYVFNKKQEGGAGTLSQNFDRMIGNKSLEQIFKKWRLAKYLDRQSGGTGISTGMAADTIRTIVSAVYLDGGWQSAYSVVHKLFFSDPSAQFLEADLYATEKYESKTKYIFLDGSEETEGEDFGDFSAEESLNLAAELDLEEHINSKDQNNQHPSLGINEQISSKKESIWNNINNSSVKTSNDQSKDSRNSPPQLEGKIKRKTPPPQRELWPSLVQVEQPRESKGSLWNKVNESTIKKPATQAENDQNSNQLFMDKKEKTLLDPQREMWPVLSHSTQVIGKK
jgi:dsRNA-specific ribonuclease